MKNVMINFWSRNKQKENRKNRDFNIGEILNKKKRMKMHIFNFAVASLATTVKGSYFIQIQWLQPSVRIFGFLRSGVSIGEWSYCSTIHEH